MRDIEECHEIRPITNGSMLVHEDCLALYKYWRALSPDHKPSSTKFDPVDIPHILPWVGLTALDATTGTWEIKMFGSEISKRLNRHASDEDFAQGKVDIPRVEGLVKTVSDPGVPHVFGPVRPNIEVVTPSFIEHVAVPFFDDNGQPSLICGIARPFDTDQG